MSTLENTPDGAIAADHQTHISRNRFLISSLVMGIVLLLLLFGDLYFNHIAPSRLDYPLTTLTQQRQTVDRR